MLHITRTGSRPIPDTVMRAMFAARKQVFVDLLKWDVPVLDGRFEVDQFDGPDAHYVVLTDRDDRHLASARLLPTTSPHILGCLYPQLCEGALPSAPDIYEVTRFCLDRSLSARERRTMRDTLIVALSDHALSSGISGFCAIAEMAWLQQILAFGWRCRPLGPSLSINGQMLGALAICIDSDTPRLLGEAGITPLATVVADAARLPEPLSGGM